jgi:hypothetical protein
MLKGTVVSSSCCGECHHCGGSCNPPWLNSMGQESAEKAAAIVAHAESRSM